jgi:HSP20 family protein
MQRSVRQEEDTGMKEQFEVQQIPVKIYRTPDRLTVATPMPGLGPEDITVEVTDGYLVLDGRRRGGLEGDKEILAEEWSFGPYHRNLALPNPVDGARATVTFGNGVLVVALPVAASTRAATLRLERTGPALGEGGEAAHRRVA